MEGKFVSQEKAVDIIHNGQTLVIGGAMNMAPMVIIREIIRQKKKDLDIICSPIGGINVDILIGADLVRSIKFGQISFGQFGQAPNFRRMSQTGKLLCRDTP